jgi:type II secretory pathway pseudopilin PulG
MIKRTLTLLEIMIVIFLITLITGAIGYNMRGALEKGKAFRTERAMDQLKELLLLRYAEIGNMVEVVDQLKESIESSGLAKDPETLMKDGWGVDFIITLTRSRNDVNIRSKKLDDYNLKHHKRKVESQNVVDDDDI